MLIRCTHCNHELRVPDQQISATGTRVLCKSCNTIFVARRGADGPARATSDILPVADDPALEEALDRILDRGPLSEASHEEPGEALDTSLGDEGSASPPSADPWAQVSPESLGISLVDDEPAAPPTPPPSALRAALPSDTGGDDVDELLDQVLRDLDRQQPAATSAASPPATLPDADIDLLAGLSLEVGSDAVRPPAPPVPPPRSPQNAPALDLESILSEIRSEAEPPAPPTTRIPPPTTTISAGFGFTDDDAVAEPGDLAFGGDLDLSSDTSASTEPGPGAHEREQSLHDIYESDDGHPFTESVGGGGEPLPPATDLAIGTGAVAAGVAQRKPRPTGPANPTGTVRTRTVTSSTRAKAQRASTNGLWVTLLLVALAAAGAGGYWFWTQRSGKPATTAGESAAPGLPTFAFEQQDGELVKVKGGLAYVVNGVVRNTSSFAVYIIRVNGVLRGSNGQETGHASSYAGNSIAAASVPKLPKAEVIATLDTRIGEGGVNVKIEPMAALPFTLVFWDVPSDASNPELTASARSFPPAATPDG